MYRYTHYWCISVFLAISILTCGSIYCLDARESVCSLFGTQWENFANVCIKRPQYVESRRKSVKLHSIWMAHFSRDDYDFVFFSFVIIIIHAYVPTSNMSSNSIYLLHALQEDLLPLYLVLWHSHPMHSRERKIVFQISDVVRWFLCTAMQWHMELHLIHWMA